MMIETDGDCCGFMQFKYNYLERWIANKFRILYFMKLFLLHKIFYCTENTPCSMQMNMDIALILTNDKQLISKFKQISRNSHSDITDEGFNFYKKI